MSSAPAFSILAGSNQDSTPCVLIEPQENFATTGGGIVTPVPLWRRATGSVCSFDGGTRCSVSVEPLPSFCHIGPGVLRALRQHELTREPVPFRDGVSVRGASADEKSYFRDYPNEGAVCFVTDEFRVILRLSVLNGVSCPSRNHCVIIFGWRAFVENPSVSAAYLRVCDFLHSLGLVAELSRINRVDVNCTVNGVSMSIIREAFCGGFFCSRSAGRLFDNRPGVLGTLYFGGKSSPVMFRAYDKSAELMASMSDSDSREKLRLLRGQFGEDSLPNLTRFEFEMHHKFLADFAVSDFRDLEMKLSAILKYLTDKWLRVTETKHEKYGADRHRNRQSVAPWWAFLADAFASFAATVAKGESVAIARGTHQRTTGAKSKASADRWARVMLRECIRVRRENGENVDFRELFASICNDYRDPLERCSGAGEGSVCGSLAVWNYVLES